MKRKVTFASLVTIALVISPLTTLVGCGGGGGEAAGQVTKHAASEAGKVLQRWQQQGR